MAADRNADSPRTPNRGGSQSEAASIVWQDQSSPVGSPPAETAFQQPGELSGGERARNAAGAAPAVDDKALHDRLSSLTNDELARLPVVRPGTRLEQGGIYVDLNHPAAGPFKALAGQVATDENRYVANRDADYLLWNRLVGRDDAPEIERPAESREGRA